MLVVLYDFPFFYSLIVGGNEETVFGVIVIAECTFAIRTWPDYCYAAVDVFTCGKRLKESRGSLLYCRAVRSARCSAMELERGVLSNGTMRMSRRTRLRSKMQIRSARGIWIR